jgi:hypothetical protein
MHAEGTNTRGFSIGWERPWTTALMLTLPLENPSYGDPPLQL